MDIAQNANISLFFFIELQGFLAVTHFNENGFNIQIEWHRLNKFFL